MSSQIPAAKIGVIVGLDLVGDALIKLPFLRALRAAYPKSEIHWITSKGATAYQTQLRTVTRQLIDDIHVTPDWLHSRSHHVAPHFDILIDTRNRWRAALQARKTVPHGTFIAPAWHFLFSDRRPSIFSPRPDHMVERLLQIVSLIAGYVPASTGKLPVSPEILAEARQILPEGARYIGFAPGAGNPIKIWPRHRFAELASLQAEQGWTPVFLLGPQELGWHEALKGKVSHAKFPLQENGLWQTDKLTIEHTLAIGCCLDLAVANDSGTGHMLAAVDCPLISLFGPTSPTKLAPRVSHGLTLKATDFGGQNMEAIPVEAVHHAIKNFKLTD